MRKIFSLIILCCPLLIYGQLIKFTITGTVKDVKQAKFAYLSTLSQRIPISSPKVFLVCPLVNGRFEFNGTYDLGGKDYQHACVFVDERGNISNEELESKFRQLIWVVGREKSLRGIILEDLQLDAESPDKMSVSQVSHGGALTKQLDESIAAYTLRNKKILEFVKKYPDSPLSFDVVSAVSEPLPKWRRDRLNGIWGSPLELYNALSERLRNSKKGQELKRMIDQGDIK